MKIFLLFVLITVVVTAAPHPSPSDKLQHVILEEIIQSIKDVKDSLKAEIFVENVITTKNCTRKNFCKAGAVLSEYKAEVLGLKEAEWLLPRKLVAYTRDIHCKDPASSVDRVTLHRLLHNISQCAQKEYSKP